MSALITFLRERLAEDEKKIRERDTSLPIHFVGCYYYSNTLDAGYYCDCEENDMDATSKFLDDISSKHKIIDRCRTIPEVLVLLAHPYREHPDYASALSRGLQGL